MADKDIKDVMDEELENEELTEDAEAAEAENVSEEASEDKVADETLEDDASAETEDKDSDDKKDGLFKKKKKKDKKDEEIENLTDRLKRQMAEFENFRKRTDKEKGQMFDMGARTIVEKILPVIDNFERGLASVPEENQDDPFVSGMQMVYKQLMTELEAAGVKAIECAGEEFNPDFHNAVMQVESEELESGTIAQELQKGYMYKDSVVRHSMVSVVQ